MKNRIEEWGLSSGQTSAQSAKFGLINEEAARSTNNPQSSPLNPDALKRMQWRARRGLLELDLFLQPFVAKHYASLNEAELLTFEALLDMPDNALWDMMSGRAIAENLAQQQLLEKIKSL